MMCYVTENCGWGVMSSGKQIKNLNAVKDDTHQGFHIDNELSWCRVLFWPLFCPLGHALKDEAGDSEADIFTRVDLEFRSKASLQACAP